MKRPHIALWIKRYGVPWPFFARCIDRWAVRRVEEWRIQQLSQRLFDKMWDAW